MTDSPRGYDSLLRERMVVQGFTDVVDELNREYGGVDRDEIFQRIVDQPANSPAGVGRAAPVVTVPIAPAITSSSPGAGSART